MDICTLIIATTITTQMCYSPQCQPSADGTKQLCFDLHQCGGAVNWPAYDCKRPDGTTYIFEDKLGAQGGLSYGIND